MPERPAPDPFSLALGRIEGHLEGIGQRFDAVEKRLEGIDKRLDRMDTRLDGMATRVELRAYVTVILLALAALGAAVLRHA